jgi:DNA polymerase (family 10)
MTTARRGAAGFARRDGGRRVENAEVARVLREIADLLELEEANVFRVRAYRNAARAVEELSEPVESLIEGERSLTDIPGIGEDLAGKITEIARRGTLPMVRTLEREAPKGAVQLMHVRGIGPRRARILSEKLAIHSVSELAGAAQRGRVRRLPGFGVKTEEAILRELAARGAEERRVPRAVAAQYGEELVAFLRDTSGVRQVELAGSFRRCRETVGDLDALVAADDASAVIDRFVDYPEAAALLERGRTRAAIRLRSGLRIDLRVLPERSFGAALHYFTGSKAHNIAVRRMGQERGLKLNEYGVFRGKRWIAGRDERDVFKAVGLPWIPPELRENNGELEAAAAGTLPHLITLEAIRGDLQSHTTDSDGRDSLDAMAEAAEALGYAYLAVTDHSPAVRIAGGLDAAGFRRQWRRIDALNARLKHLTVLRGVEVDIHGNGRLDLDDRTLAGFDIVLASIHSRFTLPRATQTTRLLAAIAHPSVDIIAHPTGRHIGRRAGIDFDFDQVFHAAVDAGVWLEVDAQPERLDLDDSACRRAGPAGVTLVIDTDAHSTAELSFMRWGVDQARRGWVDASHVANTRPLDTLLKSLRRAR